MSSSSLPQKKERHQRLGERTARPSLVGMSMAWPRRVRRGSTALGRTARRSRCSTKRGQLVGRADAINDEARAVYELKPNNPAAMAPGWRQVQSSPSFSASRPSTGRVVPCNPSQ